MTTARLFLRGRAAMGALALGVLLGVSRAEAQAPAPTRDPLPPAPQPATAPPVLRPTTAPPPPAPAPARAAAGATRPATFAPVRAPASASALPPDSVRPASAPAVVTPPANAIAQCGDGTFVVPPQNAGACASRSGVRVSFPRPATPPSRPAASAPSASLVASQPSTSAPAGATMHCKDGTYLLGTPVEGRCDGNGGTAAVLAAPRAVPPPPQVRRP